MVMEGIVPLAPSQPFSGSAQTLRFVPAHEDVTSRALLSDPAYSQGSVVDSFTSGSVLVIGVDDDVVVVPQALLEEIAEYGYCQTRDEAAIAEAVVTGSTGAETYPLDPR